MKYIALICAIIAVFFGLYAFYLDYKLDYTKQKLTLAESEKNALKTEVENYNEKSLQASQQIYELRQLIQKNKESESDGYRCLFVVLPDDVRQLLVGKNK